MTVIDIERPADPAAAGADAAAHSPSAPRRIRGSRSHLVSKVVIAGVIALVVLFAGLLPQQLGGRMSYVITDGISMLPNFHADDLVILRREPTYHVGEVAAYHNPQLHVIVLHRIVAIRGGHYVFKGDNNDYVTQYEPTKSQIVGADWLHVAGGGRIVLDLRVPIVAAVLLGALWLYSFWSPRSRRQRRRHRHAR